MREIMTGNPDKAEKMMREHTRYGTNINRDVFEKIAEQL
jgi:hypothetical protein